MSYPEVKHLEALSGYLEALRVSSIKELRRGGEHTDIVDVQLNFIGIHTQRDRQRRDKKIAEERRRLQHEIDESETEAEREDSQRRLAAVNEQALKDFGLGGKPIDLNNPIKGYRAKINGRLRDVYAKIREGSRPMGKLADHFENCITSAEDGYIYSPPEPIPLWKLDKFEI